MTTTGLILAPFEMAYRVTIVLLLALLAPILLASIPCAKAWRNRNAWWK